MSELHTIMKNLYIIVTISILPLFSFSQDNKTYALEGENITLRKAYREIQMTESEIRPRNGFITIRRLLSDNGQFSEVEFFQIDENYKSVDFNTGALIKKLETVAISLKDWKRDKDYKEFSLIRLKIKNGKIEEVF